MLNKIIIFIHEKNLYEKYNYLRYFFYRFKTLFLYKRYFSKMGSKVCLEKPIKLLNLECFYFGNNIHVWKNARIEAIKKYNNNIFFPKIILQDDVTIQQGLHMTCAKQVVIGNFTAIAANVTITDINHPYDNVDIPIELQDIEVESVEIGSNCKIYNNVVILPGTKLGCHCVVGANSVVKGVYEDYSIIVGSPARVVKKFNSASGKWEKMV